MINITNILLNYRNSIRELWNNYFISRQNDEDSFAWEMDLYFENIKQELFKALVSTKVFEEELVYSNDPLNEIKVEPNLGPKGYMAMYADNIENNTTSWEHIWIKTENSTFCYIDFFDWTTETVMDCQYVRVRLVESKEFPNLVGKDFLFEAWNVNYLKNYS